MFAEIILGILMTVVTISLGIVIEAAFSRTGQVARTVASVRARLEPLAMPTDEALNLQSSIQALLIGWAAFAHAPYGSSLRKHLPIEQLALRDMRRLIAAYCP